MTKEEKLVVIDSLAEQLRAYPHFYITDIEALNAEQTASLRRKCFEKEVKLVVVKNTLLQFAVNNCGMNELDSLLNGTTALNMIALMNGADILRVHDVKECAETVRLYEAYRRNLPGETHVISV